MGVQEPALLFRTAVNLERAAKLREEQLSTGCYVLADVTCRVCLSPLGWSYLHASNEVCCCCMAHPATCMAEVICVEAGINMLHMFKLTQIDDKIHEDFWDIQNSLGTQPRAGHGSAVTFQPASIMQH